MIVLHGLENVAFRWYSLFSLIHQKGWIEVFDPESRSNLDSTDLPSHLKTRPILKFNHYFRPLDLRSQTNLQNG